MGVEYSTEKIVPEFFWPHSHESWYVINMTWQLLLEELTNQQKYLAMIRPMSPGMKAMFDMCRGRVHAYLKVLARFDGNYCGEPDKILIEANKVIDEMVRANIKAEHNDT